MKLAGFVPALLLAAAVAGMASVRATRLDYKLHTADRARLRQSKKLLDHESEEVMQWVDYGKANINLFASKFGGIDLCNTRRVAELMGVKPEVLENIVVHEDVTGVYSDWQSFDCPGERALVLVIILNRKGVAPVIINFLSHLDKKKVTKILEVLAAFEDKYAIELLQSDSYSVTRGTHMDTSPLLGNRMDMLLNSIHQYPYSLFTVAGMMIERYPGFIEENFEAGGRRQARTMAIVSILSIVIAASIIWYTFNIIVPHRVNETRYKVLVGIRSAGKINSYISAHIDLRGLSPKKALAKLDTNLNRWKGKPQVAVAIECRRSPEVSAAVARWIRDTKWVSNCSTKSIFSSGAIQFYVVIYAITAFAVGVYYTAPHWINLFWNEETQGWCFLCGRL